MPAYRRLYQPGGTYFFTVVTHERRPILTSDLARACLRSAIERTRSSRSFEMVACVLLPDHLHALWTLPHGDDDYPRRWAAIKEAFTRAYLAGGGEEGGASPSRQRQRERAIWQRRFWEHTCRDPDDIARCMDYIHWNPRKHGLADRVRDYPFSSFRRHVQAGTYDIDWGGTDPDPAGRFFEYE